MKKVLLIIAHRGFQPVEYGMPRQVLTNAGIQLITASNFSGVAVSSITNEPARVNIILDKVKIDNYDGIFFIGGPGALENLDNEKSYRIIREAAASGKIWGAICVSPRILATAGVLKDKKVTGWDGDDQLAGILEKAGAEYIHEPVVADGNLITGNGPETAEEWGKAIARVLT